jgi:hypothetical protein
MIVEYAQLEEHTEETTRDVMRLQPTNDLAAQLLGGRLGEPR